MLLHFGMHDLHWTRQGVHFACDARKRIDNARKHELDLIRASEIFFDPFAISSFDAEHSEFEDRYGLLGRMENEKLAYVVYMFREESIRLISARKATSDEAENYARQ
jgi:uncharacterized DUF497 family protein